MLVEDVPSFSRRQRDPKRSRSQSLAVDHQIQGHLLQERMLAHPNAPGVLTLWEISRHRDLEKALLSAKEQGFVAYSAAESV